MLQTNSSKPFLVLLKQPTEMFMGRGFVCEKVENCIYATVKKIVHTSLHSSKADPVASLN